MKQSNRPRQLHNLSSSAKIDWSKYKTKYYLHFDSPISIEHVKSKIQDPSWVASHAFLPSIHFTISFKKYVTLSKDKTLPISKRKVVKKKNREIYFASHEDRFIYKYYGDLLNNAYNIYANNFGIDEVALAYRNNKPGMSNIDFAYEVFNFILAQKQAVIISVDFTKFFDHIDHKALKRNIKTVLNIEELPDDWYKVLKNLTQFCYVSKKEVDRFLKQKYGIKRLKELLENRKLTRIMNPSEFRSFKKMHLFKNKKPYGIPQGSGMSAVCSNVHLIHFDQELKALAESYQGLYRRYCDDLILVVPLKTFSSDGLKKIKEEVIQIIHNYEPQGLKIQDEKTEIRMYKDCSILDENFLPSTLDYLGFVIDGRFVRIREKSVFKYYCRAYRKADTSKRIAYVTNRKGPRKELYKIYTHLGYNYKDRGNFISYAYRAHKKMSKLKLRSLIRKQVKRHWRKIHKRL